MNGQIGYLSKAWMEKNGAPDVHVTPNGGLMFIHAHLRKHEMRTGFLHHFLPKYLAQDMEADCTLFYVDENGKTIASVSFSNAWLFEASGVRRVITSAKMGNRSSITFTPKPGQAVPYQAVALTLRFEMEYNGVRTVKYFVSLPIERDMRKVLPPRLEDRRFTRR